MRMAAKGSRESGQERAMAGTCITAETFEGWKTAFLAEVEAEKRKTQAIKEAKKGGRLTGTPTLIPLLRAPSHN